jgi:alkanesulfonate monooxygenase SsuD/methylene tetrahydromethanopterin reductase-like flavin-dependent oxidoreductase (luciferase family)
LILGLGAGFVRRLEAVREYVREVRASLPELPDTTAPPPVWLAALGDGMIRLAGEIADGVLLNWCTPERVAQARQLIGEDVEIGVYVRACVGPPEEDALAALRAAAGQYASLSHYRRQLELLGLGKEGLRAAEAVAAGRPQEVPEALVKALCLLGDPGEAASTLEEFREAGADLPVVYPVPTLEPVSSMMGTVLALAPSPAVEA